MNRHILCNFSTALIREGEQIDLTKITRRIINLQNRLGNEQPEFELCGYGPAPTVSLRTLEMIKPTLMHKFPTYEVGELTCQHDTPDGQLVKSAFEKHGSALVDYSREELDALYRIAQIMAQAIRGMEMMEGLIEASNVETLWIVSPPFTGPIAFWLSDQATSDRRLTKEYIAGPGDRFVVNNGSVEFLPVG